jgi:peptidoglycan/LPS O-acetylase OafA/YrhL
MYNNFGESFYVFNKPVNLLSDFIMINWTWLMPLMFVLAGISSCCALKKRNAKEYTKERVMRLLIPLVFGILLLVPIQTYFAEKYHNNYTGGYFKQYIMFFTKKTDLTGYTGGFTPGQLWFIFYLFVISMIALPIMLKHNKISIKLYSKKLTMVTIIPLFIIPLLMQLILDFGGKSLGEYFALFLIGFVVLSQDEVIDKLEKNRWWLACFAVSFLAIKYFLAKNYTDNIYILYGISDELAMWVCVLAFLGLGKRYLNTNNKFTNYFSKASFSIYVFHQSILIAVAYYVFKITDFIFIQVVLIIALSFIITILTCEIAKRISLTRFMFGIKK